MKKILKQWDRLGTYLMLMLFGAYSTIYPIISLQQSAPYWASIVLGVEFFSAGLCLMAGMFDKPKLRMAGLLVVCVGLTTISLTIATYGGLRVLAYAFMFGAFAMQSVHDIRHERLERKRRKDEEEKLVLELQALVSETGDNHVPSD